MSEDEEDKHIDELVLDDFVPSRDEAVFFSMAYLISRLETILSYWTTEQLIKLCNSKVNTRTRAIKKIIDHVRLNIKRIVI